jgi:hypothetical protein
MRPADRSSSDPVGTALVALVAGAIGAGLTGLLQLRRDRIETLRQRQLDAADAFAAAAARALLQIKLILDSYPKEKTDANIELWRRKVRPVRDAFPEEVGRVAAHTPRVELLFGVESPASVAAIQTTFDLTRMADALQSPIDSEVFSWAYKLAAGSALRFHDEAHVVVAGSWWLRRLHKSLPDDTYDEMAAHFREAYGIERPEAMS